MARVRWSSVESRVLKGLKDNTLHKSLAQLVFQTFDSESHFPNIEK